MTNNNVKLGLGGCLAVLLLAVGMSAAIAFVFMLAWNFVMPTLFNLTALNFFQAWALLFVIHIILGGIRAVATK